VDRVVARTNARGRVADTWHLGARGRRSTSAVTRDDEGDEAKLAAGSPEHERRCGGSEDNDKVIDLIHSIPFPLKPYRGFIGSLSYLMS
jgi:hypothetical protein